MITIGRLEPESQLHLHARASSDGLSEQSGPRSVTALRRPSARADYVTPNL